MCPYWSVSHDPVDDATPGTYRQALSEPNGFLPAEMAFGLLGPAFQGGSLAVCHRCCDLDASLGRA